MQIRRYISYIIIYFSVSENIEQETKTTSALMEVVKDGVIVKSRPAVGKGHAHPGIQSIEVQH